MNKCILESEVDEANKESVSLGSEVIRNIALSKWNSSLLPSEELGLQISYSSSSTAVAIG